MFIRRLCSGRTESVVRAVTKIREAFELLDADNQGSVSISDIQQLFYSAQLSIDAAVNAIKMFVQRLEQQGRGRFSLPEGGS